MKTKAWKKTVLLAIGLIGANSLSLPAQAYNYGLGYLPYALSSALPYTFGYGRGSNLAYPLRNLMYMPYNYVPYAVNNLVRGRNYSTGTTIQYQNQNGYRSANTTYQQPYQDQEPLLGPRQRTRQQRTNQAADQISYANFVPPGAQPGGVTGAQAGMPGAQPGVYGVQGATPGHVTQVSHSDSIPPTAPQIAQAKQSAPLAAGFINSVNEKFDGDISKALFDPATRSWATAIQLVDGDTIFDADFSPACVEVVKNVLKDKNMDPVNKIETVKAILRSSPPAAKQKSN